MTGLDRVDYWLLNVVVEYRYPIDLLQAHDWEETMNSPGPRATDDELRAGVRKLARLGLVDVSRDGFYGLTKPGGAAWEHAARPDWRRFIDVTDSCESSWQDWTIVSADRRWGERYFEFARTYRYERGAVDPRSVRRDRVAPWEATYWKRLPEGFRIRSRRRQQADRWEWVKDPLLVRSAYAMTPDWYTHPGI